ncbi:MAG: hemolysin III family protein [Oligoflexia bacterium]|nr:hemolysin III family protein [Oligoflexia bacterium]
MIQKPLLRGYLHQEAFFIALGACILLIAKSGNTISFIASLVYSLGLLLLFGISAVYHRKHWVKAPKWFTALFYVSVGWIALPYFSEMHATLGSANMALIVSGGVVYTVGAVFYAFKKPNLIPNVFGYHELFHLFTIIGVVLHFIVVYQLIKT